LANVNAKVKELAIERELALQVAKAGGTALKVKVIGRRGFVDRLVLLPGGKVLFVELKRPVGGRFSPQQKQFHDELRNLNMTVVSIKNLGEIARLMSPPK
jgi:hypothetical protein